MYNLTYLDTGYRDAYQAAQVGCTNGSSAVCCGSVAYSFGNNRTSYLGFGIAPTNVSSLNYALSVNGNGTFLAEIVFDMLASGRATTSAGLSATPSANNTQQHSAVNLTGFNLLIPNGQPTAEGDEQHSISIHAIMHFLTASTCAGFIVPSPYLGTGSNMIGMTYASWQSCFNCQQPLDCVSVPAPTISSSLSTYTDQFTAFSNSTIASALTNQYGVSCNFVPGEQSSYADASFASQQTISCNYTALNVNVEVAVELLVIGAHIRLLYTPTLNLVGVGSIPWMAGSAVGTLYIDVSNSGASAIACQLAAGQCCLSATIGNCTGSANASSPPTQLVLPGQTQRLLSYVTVNETDVSGSCSFAVQANGTTAFYASAEFQVAAANPPPPSPAPPRPPPPPPESGITLTFQVAFSNLPYEDLEDANFFLVFTTRSAATSSHSTALLSNTTRHELLSPCSFKERIAAAAKLPTNLVYITALQAGPTSTQSRSITTSTVVSSAVQYPTAPASLTAAEAFQMQLTNASAAILGGDSYFQQFGSQSFSAASIEYPASAPQNVPLPRAPSSISLPSPPPRSQLQPPPPPPPPPRRSEVLYLPVSAWLLCVVDHFTTS